jgi:hypothetical protein
VGPGHPGSGDQGQRLNQVQAPGPRSEYRSAARRLSLSPIRRREETLSLAVLQPISLPLHALQPNAAPPADRRNQTVDRHRKDDGLQLSVCNWASYMKSTLR